MSLGERVFPPPPYNFGMSQEDERTEAAALGLQGGERVLSVTSAGEMALSLLALGASRVEAVDIHEGQIHLARLKAAAVARLPREETLAFLGYLPASLERRRRWLHDLMPSLPPDAPAFWARHRGAIARGVIWAGRYERYVRFLVKVVEPLMGRQRIAGLFACQSLREQEAYFDVELGRPVIRAVFRVAFHPRIYARRGMDPRGLAERRDPRPLGDQFFERFRWLCTSTPARQNHLLQLTLLGRVLGPFAVPSYLEAERYETVRERLSGLTFHREDILEYVRTAPEGAFQCAHLSNVTDWLSEGAFHDLLRALADRPEGKIRAVWRYIHAPRGIPADLEGRATVDLELGRRLQREDRFPIYGIVPVTLHNEPSHG